MEGNFVTPRAGSNTGNSIYCLFEEKRLRDFALAIVFSGPLGLVFFFFFFAIMGRYIHLLSPPRNTH